MDMLVEQPMLMLTLADHNATPAALSLHIDAARQRVTSMALILHTDAEHQFEA